MLAGVAALLNMAMGANSVGVHDGVGVLVMGSPIANCKYNNIV